MEKRDEGKNIYYTVLELKNKYRTKVYHLAKSVLKICINFKSAVNSCDNNQNRESLKRKEFAIKKRQFWLPSPSVCQRTNIPHCTYSAILPLHFKYCKWWNFNNFCCSLFHRSRGKSSHLPVWNILLLLFDYGHILKIHNDNNCWKINLVYE